MTPKTPPARPSPPKYDDARIEELRHKYKDEPEALDWQDIAADDAGVPRYGEI
jgi:hypothetical protein